MLLLLFGLSYSTWMPDNSKVLSFGFHRTFQLHGDQLFGLSFQPRRAVHHGRHHLMTDKYATDSKVGGGSQLSSLTPYKELQDLGVVLLSFGLFFCPVFPYYALTPPFWNSNVYSLL